MKIRKLLFIALGLAVTVSAGAQSASEIAAAKAMAKQYGYSENDINSMMNGRNGGNQTGNQQSQVQSYPQLNAGRGGKQANPRSASLTGILDPTTGEMAELMIGPDGLPILPEISKKVNENDIFGQDYFKSRGLGVIPSYNAPAPASYILGPGDEVTIDIWGSTVSHVVATIENDGSINMPDQGFTVTPVESLPQLSVMVFVRCGSPMTLYTGSTALAPMPASLPAATTTL